MWFGGRRRPARGGRRRQQPRRRSAACSVEQLEDRTVPSTITPTIFTDSAVAGSGSLRAAIIAANAAPGHDIINIQLASGTYELTIPNVGGQENAAATGDLDRVRPSLDVNFLRSYATGIHPCCP